MSAKKIWFDADFIYVETTENKIGKMPLSWFSKLQTATPQQLHSFKLWADNSWIHWEQLGEDLSVEVFFTFTKNVAKV
jgi:hypothetical protein